MLAASIFGPIVVGLGFDPVWFGVLFLVNMQSAFITPPYGFSLFIMRAVAPQSISTMEIYHSVLPFIAIQLVCLALVMVFPSIALWFPTLFGGN
jgi:TRAP-type mannitol/chloroaromatic compound transport system permease large subunit